MAEALRGAGRDLAQGETFQAAEQRGEKGQEQGLRDIQACARGCAFRFRGMVQVGELLGQGEWMCCHHRHSA